jgi:hypothetical protein
VAAVIVARLTIFPPFCFPDPVNLKTTLVLTPPPVSATVWDREGDTLYETPPRFELSLTSTVAVAPLGTDVPVATDTIRFELAACAAIVVGENEAPPIRTEVADWKANTRIGSGVAMAAGKETIAVSRTTNPSLMWALLSPQKYLGFQLLILNRSRASIRLRTTGIQRHNEAVGISASCADV